MDERRVTPAERELDERELAKELPLGEDDRPLGAEPDSHARHPRVDGQGGYPDD